MTSAFMLEAFPRTQGIEMLVASLPCRTIALPRQQIKRVTELHRCLAVETSRIIEIKGQASGGPLILPIVFFCVTSQKSLFLS